MKLSSLVFPALLSLAVSLPSLAAAPVDTHAGHGAAVAGLQLNHGKKWETDAPLRAGMTAIKRELTSRVHGAPSVTVSDYAALGGVMEKQVGNIVSQCKLEPQADAMLHLVIADLSQAAATLQGKAEGKPSEAVTQAVVALNNYGEYFDHPGWEPIR